MRVIVLGVGGVGAMAAWELAREGHEVIALERHRIDHDRGSSYGDSRIVRRVYPDTLYTALMADAYKLWEELQAEQPDQELFRQCGGVFCGPSDHPQVKLAQEALEASGVPFEVLNADACRERFPTFVLRSDETALFEPSMGYARASRCVRAAAALAQKQGARILEETAVTAIDRVPDGIQVVTEKGETFTADRLLLCAGPWSGPLLERLGVSLPLAVTRQAYVQLEPARRAEDFEAGQFPTWIDVEANTYGFPRLGDLPGVKIGLHDRGDVTTPETVDREVREADRDAVRRYAAQRFPDLSSTVVYEKVCLYTNTPDEHFLIDAVPELPGAFFTAGLSGHGFKFTPLLGRIAARLALGESPPYDLTRFRLTRLAS